MVWENLFAAKANPFTFLAREGITTAPSFSWYHLWKLTGVHGQFEAVAIDSRVRMTNIGRRDWEINARRDVSRNHILKGFGEFCRNVWKSFFLFRCARPGRSNMVLSFSVPHRKHSKSPAKGVLFISLTLWEEKKKDFVNHRLWFAPLYAAARKIRADHRREELSLAKRRK